MLQSSLDPEVATPNDLQTSQAPWHKTKAQGNKMKQQALFASFMPRRGVFPSPRHDASRKINAGKNKKIIKKWAGWKNFWPILSYLPHRHLRRHITFSGQNVQRNFEAQRKSKSACRRSEPESRTHSERIFEQIAKCCYRGESDRR
jgi:hypothetical protein